MLTTKVKDLVLIMMSFCMAIIVLVGCSNAGSGESNPGKKAVDLPDTKQAELKPVTIRIHMGTEYGDDDFFQDVFVNTVKAHYPNITLERVLPLKTETRETLVVSGDIPDLLVDGLGWLLTNRELGLAVNLTELAKKNNSDLSRFRSVILDANRSLDGKELLGIPWNGNYNALYYNKDIFDKFAVPYPKDGMLWPDLLELTKKVSRTDGGVTYYGYDWDSLYRLTYPLSLNVINARTNKASVDTDGWRKAFTLGKDIYSVPGNNPGKYSGGVTRFMKDKNTAMLGTVNRIAELLKDKTMNWDVVQYPSYPERPNIFERVDVHSLQISASSTHKDEAFLVANLIGSEEVQLKLVRKYARYTTLADPGNKIMNQFGADIPELKGKHVAGIFKSTYAPYETSHKLENDAFRIATQKFTDMMNGKDMNTVLREADGEINKLIGVK